MIARIRKWLGLKPKSRPLWSYVELMPTPAGIGRGGLLWSVFLVHRSERAADYDHEWFNTVVMRGPTLTSRQEAEPFGRALAKRLRIPFEVYVPDPKDAKP